MSDSRLVVFSKEYKEKCFAVWYELGRPSWTKFNERAPVDEYGRKVGRATFSVWRNEEAWDVRADEIDAKASLIVDDELLNHRVMMVKQQAARAKELQEMGIEYLREEGFDSAASAVSAVIKGAELERQSRGLGELLVRFSQMDDLKLTSEVNKLLERANLPDEILDAEDLPEEKEETEE